MSNVDSKNCFYNKEWLRRLYQFNTFNQWNTTAFSLFKNRYIYFFFARIFPKTRVVAIPNLTSPHCIMHSSHVVYSYFNQLLCTRGRREGLEVLGIT
jgi:hypothetical protein